MKVLKVINLVIFQDKDEKVFCTCYLQNFDKLYHMFGNVTLEMGLFSTCFEMGFQSHQIKELGLKSKFRKWWD